MKALITGASGFIGNALMNELTKNQIQIWALVHHTAIENPPKEVQIIKGGISSLSLELLEEIEPDVIFHLARPTFPRFGRIGRIAAAIYGKRINQKLIKTIAKLPKPSKLVYVSGSLMYGNNTLAANEDNSLNPISFAKDYYPLEMPLVKACQENNFEILIIRVPWVLGNGSWFKWIYADQISKNKAVPVFGNGENRMHFIGLNDAARGIAHLALEQGVSGIRNLYSPSIMTQREFAAQICQLTGAKLDFNTTHHERATLDSFQSEIILTTNYSEIEAITFTAFNEMLAEALNGLLKNE